ncbi:GAF domain-containing sensor histidine kinase [Spirillospora albida]|uniref:GAF domain-containing sensor histidine kinase n=1 Tax=Spirillospora albida TaxID=58123 RepID=UPI000568EC63|nr:GAF domain-containing sensor histidine kinase [Spirillospora albida]
MTAAPYPGDRPARFPAPADPGAVEVLPEPDLTPIAVTAAHVCAAPISLVILIGPDGPRITGHTGITGTDTDHDVAPLVSVLARGEEMEVGDIDADPRFGGGPVVIDGHRLRFCAAAPVINARGHVLGVVCALDERPRHLTDDQRRILRFLADSAAGLLQAHHYALRADRTIHGLRDVRAIRDRFLSSINHELRTPLTSIRSSLEFIQSGELDEPTENRFLSVIGRNSDRILHLIDELLLMASLNTETTSFSPARCDLVAIARHALDVAADSAGAERHTLTLNAPEPVAVWADAPRLQHAVGHLLDNAIKFTLDPGTITVTVIADPAPRLAVCDTGIGIGAEHIEHIFEDFYRTPEAEERAIPGTGMGLSIAGKIIDAHGGSIRTDSAPGKGTCMRITLPVPPAA